MANRRARRGPMWQSCRQIYPCTVELHAGFWLTRVSTLGGRDIGGRGGGKTSTNRHDGDSDEGLTRGNGVMHGTFVENSRMRSGV